jgi:hypothetical protein
VSVPYETLTARPSKMREASDSIQPARRAGAGQKGRRGESGPGSGGWVPVPPRLTQSCPAVSGGVDRPRNAGVSAVPQSLFDGTWSEPEPRPSCWLCPLFLGVRVTFVR